MYINFVLRYPCFMFPEYYATCDYCKAPQLSKWVFALQNGYMDTVLCECVGAHGTEMEWKRSIERQTD